MIIKRDVSTLDLAGLEVPFHAHYSGVEQITNQRTAAFHALRFRRFFGLMSTQDVHGRLGVSEQREGISRNGQQSQIISER